MVGRQDCECAFFLFGEDLLVKVIEITIEREEDWVAGVLSGKCLLLFQEVLQGDRFVFGVGGGQKWYLTHNEKLTKKLKTA